MQTLNYGEIGNEIVKFLENSQWRGIDDLGKEAVCMVAMNIYRAKYSRETALATIQKIIKG